MAVGKTTVAKELAKSLKTSYIDTDHLIEFKEDCSISDIFSKHGEQYFRQCEQKCANWIEENITNSIIATGGGFYKTKNIKKLGQIVWLNASFDEIYNSLQKAPNYEEEIAKRPLFKNKQKAQELYNSRIADYDNIYDIKVNVFEYNITTLIEHIIKQTRG